MLELRNGALRLMVGADGSLALRRGARELLPDGRVWSCAGTCRDRLVVLTEGVIAGEDAGPPSAPESVEVVAWAGGAGRRDGLARRRRVRLRARAVGRARARRGGARAPDGPAARTLDRGVVGRRGRG